MSDEALSPRQSDPLNILEPWRKVCAIDEDELVILFILLLFVVAEHIKIPPPPLLMPLNAGRRNRHFEGCTVEGRYNGLAHLYELVVPDWWDTLSNKGLFHPLHLGW